KKRHPCAHGLGPPCPTGRGERAKAREASLPRRLGYTLSGGKRSSRCAAPLRRSRRRARGGGRFAGGGGGGLGGGRLLAGQQNVFHLDGGIVLAVSAQAAVILAAAEMLDVQLHTGVFDHLADHAHAFHGRAADVGVVAVLQQQHPVELHPFALGDV